MPSLGLARKLETPSDAGKLGFGGVFLSRRGVGEIAKLENRTAEKSRSWEVGKLGSWEVGR
ncbi:MAG: hypothetical protein IJ387_05470, partial [Thermoguttaceae bacterium]|nr:hypothetical protein [Thermoguttaceae bacterium]